MASAQEAGAPDGADHDDDRPKLLPRPMTGRIRRIRIRRVTGKTVIIASDAGWSSSLPELSCCRISLWPGVSGLDPRGVIERLSTDVEPATPKDKSTATSNAPAPPWART